MLRTLATKMPDANFRASMLKMAAASLEKLARRRHATQAGNVQRLFHFSVMQNGDTQSNDYPQPFFYRSNFERYHVGTTINPLNLCKAGVVP